MENSCIQRSTYLNSSVKNMLIENFLKKVSDKKGATLKSESSFEEVLKSSQIPDLNSSEAISRKPLPKSASQSRPSSVCSNKSSNAYSTHHQDSTIPLKFLTAINGVSLKTIKDYQTTLKNDSIDCLAYCFLMLWVYIDRSCENYSGLKLLRKNSLEIFKKIISVPGNFIKNVRALPKYIRQKKVPLKDIKKSLAWISMINPQTLGPFYSLYELLKQTLEYSQLYYGTNPVFNANVLKNKNKTGSSQSKDNKRNPCDKPYNFKPKEFLLQENSFIIETNNENDTYNELSINCRSGSVNKFLNCKKLNKPIIENKLKFKNVMFFMKSRVVQRIHEKFLSFLSKINYSTELKEDKEILKKTVIEEFVKTFEQETKNDADKYIKYFTVTKDFYELLEKL